MSSRRSSSSSSAKTAKTGMADQQHAQEGERRAPGVHHGGQQPARQWRHGLRVRHAEVLERRRAGDGRREQQQRAEHEGGASRRQTERQEGAELWPTVKAVAAGTGVVTGGGGRAVSL